MSIYPVTVRPSDFFAIKRGDMNFYIGPHNPVMVGDELLIKYDDETVTRTVTYRITGDEHADLQPGAVILGLGAVLRSDDGEYTCTPEHAVAVAYLLSTAENSKSPDRMFVIDEYLCGNLDIDDAMTALEPEPSLPEIIEALENSGLSDRIVSAAIKTLKPQSGVISVSGATTIPAPVMNDKGTFVMTLDNGDPLTVSARTAGYLQQLQDRGKWKPITTAPHDATWILARAHGRKVPLVVSWSVSADCWIDASDGEPLNDWHPTEWKEI